MGIICQIRFVPWRVWRWWSGSGSPGTFVFPFCSKKSVGTVGESIVNVSGLGSGDFFLTGMESLDHFILLFVFVPRVVEYKRGRLIELFWRPKYWSTTSLLLFQNHFQILVFPGLVPLTLSAVVSLMWWSGRSQLDPCIVNPIQLVVINTEPSSFVVWMKKSPIFMKFEILVRTVSRTRFIWQRE